MVFNIIIQQSPYTDIMQVDVFQPEVSIMLDNSPEEVKWQDLDQVWY